MAKTKTKAAVEAPAEDTTSDAILTTNEVADELGTNPKTLRKFFRSDKCDIVPVGQGKRYAITPDDIDDLREAFAAWSKGKADKADAPPAEKKAKKSSKKKAEPAEEDFDEELEPTAEDLEGLDLDDEDLEI